MPAVAAASSQTQYGGPSRSCEPGNSGKPLAGEPTKSTAIRRSRKFASKTVRLHKAPTGRSAGAAHDDIIANDTVVYFDRNGHRLTRRPDKHRSDLN